MLLGLFFVKKIMLEETVYKLKSRAIIKLAVCKFLVFSGGKYLHFLILTSIMG